MARTVIRTVDWNLTSWWKTAWYECSYSSNRRTDLFVAAFIDLFDYFFKNICLFIYVIFIYLFIYHVHTCHSPFKQSGKVHVYGNMSKYWFLWFYVLPLIQLYTLILLTHCSIVGKSEYKSSYLLQCCAPLGGAGNYRAGLFKMKIEKQFIVGHFLKCYYTLQFFE